MFWSECAKNAIEDAGKTYSEISYMKSYQIYQIQLHRCQMNNRTSAKIVMICEW